MLLLAAIAQLLPARTQLEQGPLPLHGALGHLGLTVIALVYVLLSVWQG